MMYLRLPFFRWGVQETLSELMRLLEEQNVKTEWLQFLTFRFDFNE